MEYPTSSSLSVSDRNSVGTNTIQIKFHLKHNDALRISPPALTPPTPISPREPQSPDGHTSVSSTGSSDTIPDPDHQSQIHANLVDNSTTRGGNTITGDDDDDEIIPAVSFDANADFNLNFFDTPEDSSTQGGFSDPGSVESLSIESPPPQSINASNNLLQQNHFFGTNIVGVHSSNNNNSGNNLCISPSSSSTASSFAVASVAGASVAPATIATNNVGLKFGNGSSSSSCEGANLKVPSEQQFAVADSNTNTVSKSFVPCKVCGDKASGYHYGVTSCEGCKGFFRRSIQKQIEYRCLRDGKCLVIRLNRNRCQYCRFKKCLSAGMSRDSVRYGRVPKRSRELNGTPDDQNNRVSTPGTPNTPQTPQMCSVASPQDLACAAAQLSASSTADIPDIPPPATELTVYDIIMCISQAHRMYCTYTEEQTRELVRRPVVVPHNGVNDDNENASLTERRELQKIWLWQQFAARITPGVQRVVEFAKRVPGFCDFIQDDQLILIKLGFFEVWLTHAARMINDTALTFDDGVYLTRQQMDILYDNEFTVSMVNFANTLNGYNLSDTEIGLFSVMVLLAPDRTGITEHKMIAQTRECITEALRVQIVRSRASSPQAMQLMPALEAKIPELRSLGARHFSHLDWLRINWTKLRLPPLFAEIFDIPKTDEESPASTSS